MSAQTFLRYRIVAVILIHATLTYQASLEPLVRLEISAPGSTGTEPPEDAAGSTRPSRERVTTA